MTPKTKAEPSRFVWYELHTADTTPAKAFYGGVLGWGARDSGVAERHYTLVTVGDTPVGGLLQKPAETSAFNGKAGWVGYIGVDDVDVFAERLKRAHGVVHRAPEDIPGVGRFAVVADPQGAMFVLFQAPKGIEEPARPAPGTAGTPAWHELAAADWKADFDFYAELFGWSKSEAIDMGANGVYQMFAAGKESIGGMTNRMDPKQQPAWLFYFNVEAIEPAIERVKQHGGALVHGPAEVPGGQQIAICVDPQGAAFGMVSPPVKQ